VLGADHHAQGLLEHRPPGEVVARVGRRDAPDHRVELAVAQRLQQRIGRGLGDLQRHRRVLVEQARRHHAQPIGRHVGNDPEAKAPARAAVDRLQRGRQPVDVVQQAPRVVDHRLPVGRGDEAAPGPGEERAAHAALELAQGLAERRLAHAHRRGRAAKAPRLGDGHEGRELAGLEARAQADAEVGF